MKRQRVYECSRHSYALFERIGGNTLDKYEEIRRRARINEWSIALIFTAYHIGSLVEAIYHGDNKFITAITVLSFLVHGVTCIFRKGTVKVRMGIYLTAVEVSIVLYGYSVSDIIMPTLILLATIICAGLLGEEDLIFITDVALILFMIGRLYLHDGALVMAEDAGYHNFFYIINIMLIEYVVHNWVRTRNKDMKQKEEMILSLQAAEQSKNDFLANVSHEVRTPVNTINGMSEMALQESDPEKIKECLHAIQASGRNLTSVVGDILDFSELQSGKMELERETYNIASTVNDVINMTVALMEDKKIDFTVDCDANLPCALFGDEKKIRRVMMNFIHNAVKFTNEGCVSLSVTGRREEYGLNLCVTVKDTGIGMTEESMEKIFPSFNQVDTTRTRHEGGIGLGLTLSQIIIQKMGGFITVKSKYNEGTTMRFVIPQRIVDERPIVSVEKKEEINAAIYINFEQILITDVRDEYLNIINHMREQLQVSCHMYRDLATLKRRVQTKSITHVFITLYEYQEDPAFFDEISKKLKVVLILEKQDMDMELNPYILRLSKPLYVLPIASILNGDNRVEEVSARTQKFIAPEVHVLVVDDNWMNLTVITGLLRRYEIRVTTATSGQEALEKIERKEYDFIFMDHMMPEMDGVETLHRIRNKVGIYYAKIPIIAVTANAIAGSREMFMQEGFSDFIEKPVETSVLDRLLRRNIPSGKIIYVEQNTKPAVEETVEKEPIVEETVAEVVTEAAVAEEPEFKIGDLDVEKGMLYCGGKESYLEILKQNCMNGPAHIAKIEALFQEENWKNYTIEVHAVKSMMLGIGATPLSEQAKKLEFAGKEGDVAYIQENHAAMEKEYARVLKEVGEALGIESAEEKEPEELKVALPKEQFEAILETLENAVFDFDEQKMQELLAELEGYSYCEENLQAVIERARHKVNMSDYMSAMDLIVKWKEAKEDE